MQKLSISVVRFLKNNMTKNIGKFKLLRGTVVNEIFLIVSGKIKI